MKKTKYITDLILFLTMVGLVGTGIIMAAATDSGPMVQESAKYFLKLHRHQWGTIHFYFSLLFVIAVMMHLILEWDWIIFQTQKIFRTKWILLLFVFISFLTLFMAWSVTPQKENLFAGFGQGRRAESIRGKEAKATLMQKGKDEQIQKEKSTIHPAKENKIKTLRITGQFTLMEIERKTGIAAQDIVTGMNLPETVSYHEKLGQLKKQYGFSMQDLRTVVSDLLAKNK